MSKPQYITESKYYTLYDGPDISERIINEAKCSNCGHHGCLETKTLTKYGGVACGVCRACDNGDQWDSRERCCCYRKEEAG